MKVLFTFGGLPHYYNAVLNKLNSVKGLSVYVAVPSDKSATIGKGVFESDETVGFPLFKLPEVKSFYGKSVLKNINALIDKIEPDVVVTIWPYILHFVFNPFFYFKLKSKGIKLIFKDIPFRIPDFRDGILGRAAALDENLSAENGLKAKLSTIFLTLLRLIYNNLMNAHVNYVEDAYRILGSYGVSKKKIFVTYNSSDTDQLFRIRESVKNSGPILPENPFRIIHVGRLVRWKKVDLLINALKILSAKYPSAQLVIVGKGPEEDALKELSKKLSLENSVVFAGDIYDPSLLGKYFLASSVYVLAGMGGLSINEAMAFGKPVVCSVCDGTEKKLVRENFNGKFFKENDPEDLARKIDYILSEPALLKKMGENSASIIMNEVNIHTVVKGYISAFNFVTENKFSLNY